MTDAQQPGEGSGPMPGRGESRGDAVVEPSAGAVTDAGGGGTSSHGAQPVAGAAGERGATSARRTGQAATDGANGGTISRRTASPTTTSSWVTPGLAAYVVSAVALALFGIVLFAIWQLQGGEGADPDAGTIAALAGAGIAALSSLTAAYFGIKVATEQSAQAAATTARAVEWLGVSTPNSTANGNPTINDL